MNAINSSRIRFRKKTWIIAGLSALVILSVSIVLKVVNDRKAPEKILKVMAENIDLQVKNVIYTDVGQSGEKWEIKADTAQYLKKENVALFEKIRVRMLTADGKSFTLKGDKGRSRCDMDTLSWTENERKPAPMPPAGAAPESEIDATPVHFPVAIARGVEAFTASDLGRRSLRRKAGRLCRLLV